MVKDFIQYTEALELKQLGFDEPCFAYYKDGKITGVNKWDREDWGFHVITNKEVTSVTSEIVIAPTYSQAFRWFRDNGKISEIFSQLLPSNKYKWGFKIQGVEGITDGFFTYEEAELECLKKLIEIIKNK
jgi:hypothetical protein